MNESALRIALEWERTVSDLVQRTAKFPKTARYTFGQRIDEAALDVAVMVTDARYVRGERRRQLLQELNLRLNRLRLLTRLAHANGFLDHGAFEYVSREVDAFGRGLGAWMKQVDGGVA